jgi:hypothetical protein
MAIVQYGPPEWVWERTPDNMKWNMRRLASADGEARYELRLQCGLQILRMHFFDAKEMWQLVDTIAAGLMGKAQEVER